MSMTDRVKHLPRPLRLARVFVKRHLFWWLKDNKIYRKVRLPEIAKLNKEEGSSFLVSAAFSALFVLLVSAIWPGTIPYSFFEFWSSKGTISEWFYASRWVFAWGVGFTIFASFTSYNKPEENRNAEAGLALGVIISVLAGVLEEICFRWLIFFSSIITAKVVNFLFFGFLGFGILEWLQLHLLGPIANFFTLGLLQDVLTNPAMWAVGAGMLTANAAFRDGHKYLGIIGFVNSWFIGMFFFYLMFTYGLPAAILVHFLYDLGIFAVRYIDCVIERAQGRA